MIEASRVSIQKQVTKVEDELFPTDEEIKDIWIDLDRESKFNPVSSNLKIIRKAEELGKRLQEPIDASIARYNLLLEKDKSKKLLPYVTKP